MAKMQPLVLFFLLTMLFVLSKSVTDERDVMAMNRLFQHLSFPPQLEGWNTNGSPCDEIWLGVKCSGSAVTSIKIKGLNLHANLGYRLSYLHNLKELDVSHNHFNGSIPFSLPSKITSLNLACNNFSSSLPLFMSSLNTLEYLNLSQNFFSGPLTDVFYNLKNLREMDLSFNNFDGFLPISFASLTNLSQLFLQHNEFTGSVILLAELPLSNLNIQSNNFSGVLPYEFRFIQNLWLDSNSNDLKAGANDPPWEFPTVRNASSPPPTSKPVHTSKEETLHAKKRLAFVLVGGGLILLALGAVMIMLSCKRNGTGKCSETLPLSVARDSCLQQVSNPNPLPSLLPSLPQPSAEPSPEPSPEPLRRSARKKKQSVLLEGYVLSTSVPTDDVEDVEA